MNRAPLTSTVRGTASSIGGSEYSFPPSYRSRNTTPGTISSDRSIEIEPSGRLLANEDIPEPLSVEQISEYSSLQQRRAAARATAISREQKSNKKDFDRMEEKCAVKERITKDKLNANEDNHDMVTIVTITAHNGMENGNETIASTLTTNSTTTLTTTTSSSTTTTTASTTTRTIDEAMTTEQTEILAHL
uniref:Uncharacterized protein n=1 Tax=Glossina pallidipes TaxID=7398 RepID=A0A1B0AFM8_GLOPL